MGKYRRKKPTATTLPAAVVRLASVLMEHRSETPVTMAAAIGPCLAELGDVLVFSSDPDEREEGRRLRALLSGTPD